MTSDPAGSEIFTRFLTLTLTSFDPLGRVSGGQVKVNPGLAPGQGNIFNMIIINCLSCISMSIAIISTIDSLLGHKPLPVNVILPLQLNYCLSHAQRMTTGHISHAPDFKLFRVRHFKLTANYAHL